MIGRVFLGLMALVVLGCGNTPTASDTVRIALNWFPEHEHGGYFAALADGTYAAAGLPVQLLPGGPGAPVIARVASGDVDFGVLNADDVVVARAAGAPLVALLAPIQTSPWCIMVHRASGIERLADLRDVTLAIQITAPQYQFLRGRSALPGVTIVPYGGSIAPFLLDPRYAQQAYLISEPILAAGRGSDPHCLPLAELGFDPYTSVLVARQQLLRERPALVDAVTRASRDGWEHYLADPAAAHAAIRAENPQLGDDLLRDGVAALRPLIQTGAPLGSMTLARWSELAAALQEIGVIERPVAPADCFVTRALPPS